jgi:malate permease and related proteins
MNYLSLIFFQIVAPILILLMIGVLLHKKFKFQLKPLANLLTYCFMPAAVFSNLYESALNLSVFWQVTKFIVLFMLCQMLLSALIAKVLGYSRTQSAIFKNSIVLINSGNYGMPVAQMIFATQPIGVAIQVIVVIFQNMLTYTYGLYNLISTTKSGIAILKEFLKMPLIHALWIGIACNYFHISLPIFIDIPIHHIADAFIAMALITLGAQLSQIEIRSIFNKFVFTSAFVRLMIGPSLALLIIYLLKLDGVVAQSLLIASAFPTSRNSSSLALEYDIDSSLAAQTVLFSTIVSCITVTIVIYLSQLLYPF